MAEIRENETTENSSSTSLPPETLTGRKLDYAVNLIKDNPLDEINQKIIKQLQDDYPNLKDIFPRTAEELQNLSQKILKELINKL